MIPSETADLGEGSQKRGREDAARAEARAFGRRGEEGNFEAAAEFSEDLVERSRAGVGAEAGMKSGKGERGLGEGKFPSNLRAVLEILEILDARFRAEIDRSHDEMLLRSHPCKNLHGRLAIEFQRDIHDGAAVFQAVGRSVRPTASEIDANGTAAPDDLVLHGIAERSARTRGHRPGDRAGEGFEGGLLKVGGFFGITS